MRSYDSATAALAIGVPAKWLDNLLSHYPMSGVGRSRQGVQRQISMEGLLAIELTRMLSTDLHLPLSEAAALSAAILEGRTESRARHRTPTGVEIVVDVDAVERRLMARLVDAVQSAARAPRGRPARSR